MIARVSEDPYEPLYSLRKNGQADKALQKLYDDRNGRLRAPFSHDPNHAWYFVGTLLFDRGEYQRAIRAFRSSLRSRPDDVAALWALGNSYAELGRPKLAARYFEKAIALPNGHRHELLYNLANALVDQGKYEDALSKYRVVSRSKNKDLAKRATRNAALAKNQI